MRDMKNPQKMTGCIRLRVVGSEVGCGAQRPQAGIIYLAARFFVGVFIAAVFREAACALLRRA